MASHDPLRVEVVPVPVEAGPGVALIAAERVRQVRVEHFDAKHDDEHPANDSQPPIPLAAACYAASAAGVYELVDGQNEDGIGSDLWPWDAEWDKRPEPDATDVHPEDAFLPSRSDRIRVLVKAGALCAAEVDRLLREEAREAGK